MPQVFGSCTSKQYITLGLCCRNRGYGFSNLWNKYSSQTSYLQVFHFNGFFGGFKLYFLYLLEITYLYLIKDENKGFDDFNQVLLFDIRSYFNSNITPLQPRIVVHPFQLTFLKHIFKYKSIEMLDISPRLLLRMIIQHYEDHS